MDLNSLINSLLENADSEHKTTNPSINNDYYEIVKHEDRTTIIHNCIGIPEAFIKLSIESKDNGFSYLVIKGTCTDEELGNTYSIDSRFTIMESRISNIEWKTRNGILIVDIVFKKPETKSIPIQRKM